MHPYENIKFPQGMDVADLQEFGLKSSAGHLRGKGGDYKNYIRSAKKRKATRRYLKRRNKAIGDRLDRLDNRDVV